MKHASQFPNNTKINVRQADALVRFLRSHNMGGFRAAAWEFGLRGDEITDFAAVHMPLAYNHGAAILSPVALSE